MASSDPDALRSRVANLPSRYQFLKKLGSGGMGAVVLAVDRELRRKVAIKLLLNLDRASIQRFLREARAMANIRHANLVELLDFSVEAEEPYIVMEYLEGGDLHGVSLEDPLEPMLQVAAGLQALHDAGALHRDVKPANIFRCGEGRVVLADLGMALLTEGTSLTKTGAVLGTLRFLAPELVFGRPHSPASDWYAWGISLYAMAEGQWPFSDNQIRGILSGGPCPAPQFSRLDSRGEVAQLISLCVANDPEDRPENLVAIRGMLERKVSGTRSDQFLLPGVEETHALGHHSSLPSESCEVSLAQGRTKWWRVPAVMLGMMGLVGAVVGGWTRPSSVQPLPEMDAVASPPPERTSNSLAQVLDELLDNGTLEEEYRREGARAYRLLSGHLARLEDFPTQPPNAAELASFRSQDNTLEALGMLPLFEPFLPANEGTRFPSDSAYDALIRPEYPVEKVSKHVSMLRGVGASGGRMADAGAAALAQLTAAQRDVERGLLNASSVGAIPEYLLLTSGNKLKLAVLQLRAGPGGPGEVDRLFHRGVAATRRFLVVAQEHLSSKRATRQDLFILSRIALSARFFLYGSMAMAPPRLRYGRIGTTLAARIFREVFDQRLREATARGPGHLRVTPAQQAAAAARCVVLVAKTAGPGWEYWRDQVAYLALKNYSGTRDAAGARDVLTDITTWGRSVTEARIHELSERHGWADPR